MKTKLAMFYLSVTFRNLVISYMHSKRVKIIFSNGEKVLVW